MKTHIEKTEDKTAGHRLKFIICGLEHSGTTLISDLFREHPDCDSGFECGVLLARTPREFPGLSPFYENMKQGWGLEEKLLFQACQTDKHLDFYKMIFEHSSVLKPKKASTIFDKTPRYIIKAKEICRATGIPMITAIKDPRAIAASDFIRSGFSIKDILKWYDDWKPKKIPYMRKAYDGYSHAWQSSQCIVIRLEDLCLETKRTFESMFAHVGIKHSIHFLHLKNKRYHNTRGNGIAPTQAFSFSEVLPAKVQSAIMHDFKEFDRWFYDFG